MATYLAYGSNLSIEQMKVRCPDARIIGKGIMKDWRLLFRQYATIERCDGFFVPVLVWQLSRDDEESLDRYEGYPNFYGKETVDIDVTSLDGKELGNMNGLVYVMTKQAVNCRTSTPSNYYFALLAEGYRMFGFDTKILDDALREADALCDKISAINH